MTRAPAPGERVLVGLLLTACAFAYAYFFHGDGWNQASHYTTIRSLVERRSFEITPFEERTGDVSTVEGRVYSNKPPGMPLVGAAPYLVLTAIERVFGHDPTASRVDRFNQYVMTLLLSAVPAVLLVWMLYTWFRTRDHAAVQTSLALAAAFAFGTLAWPYAGMLFNHLFVAALLFGAWMLLSADAPSKRATFVAGLALGLAALSEYIIGPLVFLFVAYEFARRRDFTRVALLCVGPALALSGLLLYHRAIFGSPFTTSYAFESPEPGLFLGKFHSPEWMRLYWLSYHRYRGIFINCPAFVLVLLSLFAIPWRRLKVELNTVFPLLVVGYFIAFHLVYVSWAGGWGVGPRFFIPAMAFFFLYARRGLERFPWLGALFIAVSVFNMLSVTSVRALFPGNDKGPPTHYDPLGECLLGFVQGRLMQTRGSFNFGTLMGLNGRMSLLPLLAGLALLAIIGWTCWRRQTSGQPIPDRAENARL